MSYNPFHNSILVPVDYSPESINAISHAVLYAQKSGNPIVLFHVVKDVEISRRTHSLIQDEHDRLAVLADKHVKPSGVKVATLVRFGDVFEIIGHTANEFQMSMVVMATHGVKGMQFITGSHALKIIENGRIPFLVVQGKAPKNNTYEHVIFPVDYEADTKQKLVITPILNKLFGSKIHVLVEHYGDEFLANKTKANLAFIENYFADNNINYEVNHLDGSSDLAEATVEYANAIQADLILIMVDTSRTVLEFFTRKDEQDIISNKYQIPVICLNPTEIGTFTAATGFS
jgi:nucleotide-binding universal stress UspA family protein